MRRRIVLASFALIMAAAACVLALEATARTRASANGDEGEVVIKDAVVIRIRSAAGGFTATQRARDVATRLNQEFKEGATWRDFRVGRVGNEAAVLTETGHLIITADRFHAEANGTTPELLAAAWRSNLVQALGGEPQAVSAPAGADPSPGDATPPAASTAAAAATTQSWERQADKIVPIFSVGTPGVSVGGARVVGPAEGVARVKGVAQVEAEFKDVLRAHIYIPVSAISAKPQRVQGVSVEALLDYNVPF